MAVGDVIGTFFLVDKHWFSSRKARLVYDVWPAHDFELGGGRYIMLNYQNYYSYCLLERNVIIRVLIDNSKCARCVSQVCETITKIHHRARGYERPLFIRPTVLPFYQWLTEEIQSTVIYSFYGYCYVKYCMNGHSGLVCSNIEKSLKTFSNTIADVCVCTRARARVSVDWLATATILIIVTIFFPFSIMELKIPMGT